MKERLTKLRKTLGLTQKKFGERLSVTASAVGGWEIGKDKPGRRSIDLICDKFNVRRAWLETGEGEMFEPKPEKKEKTVEEAMDDFVEAVARTMTDEQRDVVAKLLQRAADEMERDEKKWKPE